VRAFSTHGSIVIRKRATERGEVFAFYTWIGVKALAVDAMLRSGVIGYNLIGTMRAKLMSVIYPPAVTMVRMITRVCVSASTYFTYSVWHNTNNLLLNFL
jgi:hypothetical protein